VVHEDIFATIFWGDEAEALLFVEPLDRSLGHVPKKPHLSFLRFLRKGQRPILTMLAGSASGCIETCFDCCPKYIAEKKKREEEPEAPEKTPVPVMSPSFQELYEEDCYCTKNDPAC
jgi:hypothetical protein